FFMSLSSRYGLKELALQGAVLPGECSYQAFKIDPVSIGSNQVDAMFPLRSSLFSEGELTKLSQDLRIESNTQELQYRKFLTISKKYPDRRLDLSIHDGRGWDEHLLKRAINQQKDFAKEIIPFITHSDDGTGNAGQQQIDLNLARASRSRRRAPDGHLKLPLGSEG